MAEDRVGSGSGAAMTEALRYPVGRFASPTTPAPDDMVRWCDDLRDLPARLGAAVAGLDDAQLDTPYREGGWTVRQTVHHVADSHLNATCRFRLALTEDNPVIKPYLEARWAELDDARSMAIGPSLDLLDGLHRRWLALIDAMQPADWQRTFVHPEHGRTMTLWQLLALYAWHSRHHVAHIVRLRERRGWLP